VNATFSLSRCVKKLPSRCSAIRNRGLPSSNRLGKGISRHRCPYQLHFPLRSHPKLRHASRHDDRITLGERDWLNARGFANSATLYRDHNLYRAFAEVINTELVRRFQFERVYGKIWRSDQLRMPALIAVQFYGRGLNYFSGRYFFFYRCQT